MWRILLVLSAAAACAAEKVEVLRDEYGVAHIFAQTAPGAAYGSGYAQAADRLEELLRDLRRADGNSAGDDARIAKDHYSELAPNIRAIVEAFCSGVNRYIYEHPRQRAFKVEPWMIVAYSRYVLGDYTPTAPTPVSSNEMLIGPSRTASKAVIAIIDPHGSWYGETRLYAMCAYGGELAWCGSARVGLPFPTAGHGYNVSIAITPGGPATPYQNEFRMLEQAWAMITAKNLGEIKKALAMRQYGASNIMVGTADGDIFKIRDGGAQTINPPKGYLYNPERTPLHQRAAMTSAQLQETESLTLEQAANLAFSTEVYRAQAWQARIAKAAPGSEFARMLTGWSRRSDADSRPALAFYLFKTALGEAASAIEPPESLSDDRIRAALRKAQDRLETEFPFQAAYGTLFRVGRDGSARSYPVGGGTMAEAGMATPRAIDFERRGNIMMGAGGQSATQIVQLSRPPKSYMVMPLGESDDPKSPHFDDQAAKLFSKARAASTYFGDRKELEKHVKERKELVF